MLLVICLMFDRPNLRCGLRHIAQIKAQYAASFHLKLVTTTIQRVTGGFSLSAEFNSELNFGACRKHAALIRGSASRTPILIQNVHSYYSQYLPHVKSSLQAGLEPVEKHLKVNPLLQIQ